MDQESGKGETPSFEEILGGKDVALGKEIVEQLITEELAPFVCCLVVD